MMDQIAGEEVGGEGAGNKEAAVKIDGEKRVCRAEWICRSAGCGLNGPTCTPRETPKQDSGKAPAGIANLILFHRATTHKLVRSGCHVATSDNSSWNWSNRLLLFNFVQFHSEGGAVPQRKVHSDISI